MSDLYEYVRHPHELEMWRYSNVPNRLIFRPAGDRFSYCNEADLWLVSGFTFRRLAYRGSGLRSTLKDKQHFKYYLPVTV